MSHHVVAIRTIIGVLATAVVVTILALGVLFYATRPPTPEAKTPSQQNTIVEPVFVAQVTGATSAKWAGGATHLSGQHLQQGQHLELDEGVAEITFRCGARIVLEGPATCTLHSEHSAHLQQGRFFAEVPDEAIGFQLHTPTCRVTAVAESSKRIAETTIIPTQTSPRGPIQVEAGESISISPNDGIQFNRIDTDEAVKVRRK